jgi:AraC-like DNA-binding protein
MKGFKITLGDAVFTIAEANELLKRTSKWETTSHFHADNEIHIILNGSATVEIGGENVVLTKGDVCVLAPNFSHYPKESSIDLEKTVFSFRLNKTYNNFNENKSFSEHSFYDGILRSIYKYAIVKEKNLISIIEEILSIEKNEQNNHVIEIAFATFFISLCKKIKEINKLYNLQMNNTSFESESAFKQRKIVEEFFQKRYNEQIGIEDLAKELCLSIPQTHRIVKKIFSVGFKKTLMKQRIEHALMLIKHGKEKIADVALLCGYDSYNGFLSAFKSYTGKAPKEYEKSFR